MFAFLIIASTARSTSGISHIPLFSLNNIRGVHQRAWRFSGTSVITSSNCSPDPQSLNRKICWQTHAYIFPSLSPGCFLCRTQNPARPLSNQHSEPLQLAKPSPYPPFLPITHFLLGCHLSLLKPAIFPLSKTRKRTPCLSSLSSLLCRLYSSVFLPASQPRKRTFVRRLLPGVASVYLRRRQLSEGNREG